MDGEAKVGVIIQAEDQATSVISGIRGSLSNLNSSLKTLEPAFKSMAVVGTAAFGAIALFAKQSVDAANEAALVQAQLGAVLKSTGGIAGVTADAAIKLSKALESTTTFSDEAVLSAENLLLTFTSIKSNVFPQATKTVLDMATALGEDTSSAAIQLGKALQDPILGVTALRRVGVNFSSAQQDVIKKLVESGHLLTAQKMILKELGTEFGGSATAKALTFAGAMEQLSNQVNDFQEEVGNALIPVIQKVTNMITPIVAKFTEWAQANPQLVARILEVGAAVAGLTALIGLFGLALIPITAALEALLSPVGLTVLALVALAGVVVALQGKWTDIFRVIDQNTGLITLISTAWKDVADKFTKLLLPALKNLWDALQPLAPFLKALGEVAIAGLLIAVGTLVIALNVIANTLTLVLTVATTLASFFTQSLLIVFHDVQNAIESVVGWADKLFTSLSKLNLVQGAKSVLSGAASAAGKIIGVNDAVISPQGNVITTAPDDYLIATKDPSSLGMGSGLTFNFDFTGATIADKDQFIKQVTTAMSRQFGLAKMGVT